MYITTVFGRILVKNTKYYISNFFFYTNYLIQTIGYGCFKYCVVSPFYYVTKINNNESNDYDIEKNNKNNKPDIDLKKPKKPKKTVTFQPKIIYINNDINQDEVNHNNVFKPISNQETNLGNDQNTPNLDIEWDIL
tara:strand:+ start:71 stop:478 length:408 start_codon:yes stop_codon:yes gene_type:complete